MNKAIFGQAITGQLIICLQWLVQRLCLFVACAALPCTLVAQPVTLQSEHGNDAANHASPFTGNQQDQTVRLNQSTQTSTRHLTLVIGHAHVLRQPTIKRIAVGDGKVIQATALDNRQVLVLPEKEGQSTLHLWPAKGPLITYLITVVSSDAARSLGAIRAMLGHGNNVQANLVGESVLIEGHALSAGQLARVKAIEKRFPHAVNLVAGASAERMIAMDVQMIEIKKSALQKVGIRWSSGAQGPSFGILGDLYRSSALSDAGLASELGLPARARLSPFATALSIGTSVTSVLDYLVRSGDAVILAEPRLSCRSGGSARFVAGGELPIPQSSGLGAMSVTFKEYGVRFEFSPVAGLDGMIAAKIATEVSAIDFDVKVQDVPGLVKRRAETEVNLQENQTLVIAGLLAEEASGGVDKVAGLADLPVLGKLFRSRDYRSQKTDLVVFVTPRLVDKPGGAIWQAAQSNKQHAESLMRGMRIVE